MGVISSRSQGVEHANDRMSMCIGNVRYSACRSGRHRAQIDLIGAPRPMGAEPSAAPNEASLLPDKLLEVPDPARAADPATGTLSPHCTGMVAIPVAIQTRPVVFTDVQGCS